MNKNEVIITTRDKLMRSWQNSMELVRDFENYSKEESGSVKEAFKKFAEDEAFHASTLRDMLLQEQRECLSPSDQNT